MRPKPGGCVVAVSPWLKDRIHEAYGTPLAVQTIVPGASFVAPDPLVRARVRNELRCAPTEVVCLLVARNPLRKGLAAVLCALERLPEHFRLIVVGAKPHIKDYVSVNHPGLVSRVSLVAPTPDVSPYYQAADVYVHPTLLDSFGLAPLEAMAHGLPVLMSGPQYCGFGRYVTHRHDAWVLTDPEDAGEIAQGLEQLMTDPVLRAKILTNSLKLVESLSWEQAAQKFEALYAESIEARR